MAARPATMSVEQPLWRALTAYRVLTCGYAVALGVYYFDGYARPWVAVCYLALLTGWTLATLPLVSSQRCTRSFLIVDLTVALGGILLTTVANPPQRVDEGVPTLSTIWTAGAVLACALKAGWRWAAVAATLVGAANVAQRSTLTADILHNVLLLLVAGIAIGYVVEVARATERTLARALQIEAATRERERLARGIHDSVLQVLAMVQRRGTALGGEAAELGRLAGEQEIALRTLVSGGAVPEPRTAAEGPEGPQPVPSGRPAGGMADPVGRGPGAAAPTAGSADCDLRSLLARYAGPGVLLVEPGAPVLLEQRVAGEVAAAVAAALDNVRTHAVGADGTPAGVWILVEDEPDSVLVTVRDDGPGIPAGRLADAEREGRMGVALSIRGRLRDLGGSARLESVPGQGTEVELRVPRGAAGRRGDEAEERRA